MVIDLSSFAICCRHAGNTKAVIRAVKDDASEILVADEEWGHRRASMRHDLAVPAHLGDLTGIEVDCVIEDVSSTGMLLSIDVIPYEPNREPFKQGTNATLEFAPDPLNAPDQMVTTQVRIMWRAPVALGIAFVEQSPSLRAGLRAIAQAAVRARVDADMPTELSAEQRAILKACRKTMQTLLPNIVWTLRTDLVNGLLAQDDNASAAENTAARADAALIEEKAMAMTRTIEHQFLQSFSAVSDLEQTQEMTLLQLKVVNSSKSDSGADVAIEGRSDAEHGAGIAAIAHAVEERYKSKFFELSVRLANVLGRPLDANVNPLVPARACGILWQAATNYCDSARVRKQLRATMTGRVAPLLGELYEGINKTLDEHGAKRIFDVRK
jgi:hypothetical protein